MLTRMKYLTRDEKTQRYVYRRDNAAASIQKTHPRSCDTGKATGSV